MTALLTDPRFLNPEKAREWLETQRWRHGRVCPHCGDTDRANLVSLKGRAHRQGLYQCKSCREQFTVTVGTVMERSKIPLNKWVAAMHLMCAGKKGTSAHQLHRMLGITYQSAWFLAHRIREAMRADGLIPMGGGGRIVEADETYFGKVHKSKRRTTRTSGKPFTKSGKSGPSNKRAILALVERGGSVRSFHIERATRETITGIVRENVERESRLHTDESRLYSNADGHFVGHERVRHTAGEYARGYVHTNTIEGYFSIFKRGMKGVYQHCAERHLHRYLSEFDYRYNHRIARGVDDEARTSKLVRQAEGKRLTYRAARNANG